MFFLIAGFICSAIVSLVLKASNQYQYDRYGMLTINYCACLIPFTISEIGSTPPAFDADLFVCIALSVLNGFLYIAGMVLNALNVNRNGAILQSAFARLGVMIPTCLSIILFGERPTLLQSIGILIVLAAFCIMNISGEKEKRSGIKPSLPLLLLGLVFGGLADSMLKIFQEVGTMALDDWFMGLTFLFAALLSFIAMTIKKGHIGRKEAAIGIALGIPNYLSSLFLLKSLKTVSAYIAYPTYSVGAILTVTAISILVFRERLSCWNAIAVLMIAAAIAMLNI